MGRGHGCLRDQRLRGTRSPTLESAALVRGGARVGATVRLLPASVPTPNPSPAVVHVPLVQATQNVVPVGVTAGDKIEGLRQWALEVMEAICQGSAA